MDRNIESYRTALEQEINRWNGFVRALRKDDKEAFDELMDMGRIFASECSHATQSATFEPMVMSILLAHQEKMGQIEKALNALEPVPDISSEDKKPAAENHQAAAMAVSFKWKPAGGEQTRLS